MPKLVVLAKIKRIEPKLKKITLFFYITLPTKFKTVTILLYKNSAYVVEIYN